MIVECALADDLVLNDNETVETYLPKRQTAGSGGYDLTIREDIIIPPGHLNSGVPTGIKIKIPDGIIGFVAPRSGLGSKGLMITNTPGIIDWDYRGEMKLNFFNCGTETIELKRGNRVAQILFVNVEVPEIKIVNELSDNGGERGIKGHGSTGL